jgi:O-acetyl-ADP-ribose deacetylase (regulator of RNase III)
MNYNEVNGDLIHLAKKGTFDVIAHGSNCMSAMGAGIAVPLKNEFGCDKFPMELQGPSIEKLGCIDYKDIIVVPVMRELTINGITRESPDYGGITVTVVNAYTQYYYGRMNGMPLDYEALTLCMRKINSVFKGKHIGLPKIGAGLAGGDWNRIKQIIQTELKDCKVTVVLFDK